MTNREKLLDILNKMSDRELAESIEMYCDICPAEKFCASNPHSGLNCQDSMELWLAEGEEK